MLGRVEKNKEHCVEWHCMYIMLRHGRADGTVCI